MKEQKLVFDEMGIRLLLPFEEETNPVIKNEKILERCGCSPEGLTSNDYERRAQTQIANSYVFHVSETSLMQEIGEKLLENGGDVLEIGFGMGMTADIIYSASNVNSHTIIEVNPYIYEKGLEWAKDKPSVNIILGNWFDVLPTLSQKFNSVFHNARLDTNLSKLLDTVKPLCNEDAIICFFRGLKRHEELLNIINHKFTEEEIISAPYFGPKGWDWSYTTFNGSEFIK